MLLLHKKAGNQVTIAAHGTPGVREHDSGVREQLPQERARKLGRASGPLLRREGGGGLVGIRITPSLQEKDERRKYHSSDGFSDRNVDGRQGLFSGPPGSKKVGLLEIAFAPPPTHFQRRNRGDRKNSRWSDGRLVVTHHPSLRDPAFNGCLPVLGPGAQGHFAENRYATIREGELVENWAPLGAARA